MKILLSPSKTKDLKNLGVEKNFAPEIQELILQEVVSLQVDELAKAMKLKLDKAEYWLEFYKHLANAPKGEAISSYNGLVFKRLAYGELTGKGQAYCVDKVRILSGFYGVIEPLWQIVDYRLDLVDKIKVAGKNLTKLWQPLVTEYFQKEDWILNLASKEYSALVQHPFMVTVEFVKESKGKFVQGSTASKEMRGVLTRYCCEHQVEQIRDLPKTLGEYTLVSGLPEIVTENLTIRYVKK